VSRGEAARIAESGDARSVEVHPATAAEFERRLSWRHRRIVFSRTPLSEAVAEMNRYNFRRLVVADASIASVAVSGSFQSDNLEAFVRLLAEGFDVAAEATDGQVILRKHPAH
jgi:transmembrane sensor